MKKNESLRYHLPDCLFTKYILMMKLAIIVSLFFSFQSFALNGLGQNKINLNIKNSNVESILKKIETQTNYRFVYSEEVIQSTTPVSVYSKNEDLDKVLNKVLAAVSMSYKKGNDNLIIVFKNYNAVLPPVTGHVMNDKGEALVGASVILKGTTTGTVTDADGAFTLNANKGDVLVISAIGFTTQEVTVGNEGTVTVALTAVSGSLDEVVVVGYGTSTKKSLVSSVAQVKTEDFSKLPTSNITQSLAGRAAGLIVQSGSGLNSKASISIRGGGDPLYIIDGIIRSANDFANLNADDIETMSILKDASSTAVYGMSAAYGVVQVTTKAGKNGRPQVNYSVVQTWGQPSFWAKRVSSYESAKIINEARINEGLGAQFTEDQLKQWQQLTDTTGQYVNTDWRKLVLKSWAPTTRHTISMAGGSDFNNYYTSVGYTDMNSLFKSGRYTDDRYNFNLSNTTNIKDIGLKITAQISGFIEKTNDIYTSEGAGNGYIIQQVGMKEPDKPGINKYGLPYDLANNPVADVSQDAGYLSSTSTVLNGLLNAEWSVPWVKGLKFRATGNYNWYDANTKNWRKDAAKYGWNSLQPLYAAKPQLYMGDGQGSKVTFQYFGYYDKVFGDHSISALGGYEANYGKYRGIGLNRYNYNLSIDQVKFGPTDDMDNSSSESEYGNVGIIGQLKYGFKSRYYIEGSIRRDGSDVFPKNSRWGSFYSVSGGWILSDEGFMSGLKERNIFNFFKLRGSYGQVGMTQGIGRYLYLDMYNYTPTGYVYDGKMYPTLYEGAAPSVNLTWYTDNQYGAGFDFESLQNRLYGSFDYFLFATTGYMANPDPKSIGYIAPYGRDLPQIKSEGEKRRAGFDFQIGYRKRTGDFKYDIGFNYTWYDVFWANYPYESLDTKMNPYTRQTGQYEHFSQVGYHYLGTASSAAEWMKYAQRPGSTNLTGGDFIYEDFNGDGRITGEDQYRIGYAPKPLINYGVPMNFSYKGFNLSLLLQGAGKRDLLIDRTFWSYNYLSRYDYQLDYWTPENTNAKFPRIVSTQAVNGGNNTLPSEAWAFNGKYIRLKSAILGYDLKYSLLKNANWFRTCNISLTAQNLFTISEATKFGIDPEVGNTLSSYPIERVIGINLNIGF